MANPEQEALAGMAKVGAPRKPMGKDGVKFTAAKPQRGKSVKRGNAAAGDPTLGGAAIRKPTSQMGAAYSVGSKYMKQTEPAAGSTLANAPIVPPVMRRQKPNFEGEMGMSY